MPKRRQQVGEEELTSGLKGFGSLDQITEHKPRRDSPFRDTREVELAQAPERKPDKVVAMRPTAAEPVSSEAPEQSPDVAPELNAVPQGLHHSNDAAERELLERARAAREGAPVAAPPTAPSRAELPVAGLPIDVETRQTPRTIEEAAREVRVLAPESEDRSETSSPPRKADLFSERVTLLMSSEMRDRVESLAKELQRRKTTKSERITSNTVMRVAINAFLESFELREGDVANTEEEFERLVRN